MKTLTCEYRMILLLILCIFLFSCEKDLSEDKVALEVKKITGNLDLPADCIISAADLQISTPVEIQNFGENGSVTTNTLINDKPQMVVINDNKDNPILLGLVPSTGNEPVSFSAATTAQALVLINPLFSMTTDEQRNLILNEMTLESAFQHLVLDIEKLLKEDPENVLNYDAHPGIYQQAVSIAFTLLKKDVIGLKSTDGKTEIQEENPWIEESSNNNITIYNPKTAHYASDINISGTSDNNRVLFIPAKDGIVSFQFGWPPIYLTEPQATDCKLDDGNYQIRMTKGFDFSVGINDFFNPSRAHGLATLANTGKFGLIMFDLIVGLDLAPKISFTDLHLDLAKTSKEIKDLGINVNKRDYMAAMGNLVSIVLENADEFALWLWQEASQDAMRNYVVKSFSVLKKVAVVTNIVSTGETFANQLVPFLYDMFDGESWISYNIGISGGKLTDNIANNSPLKPTIYCDKQWSKVGEEVIFYAFTSDPDNHKVSLRFHWGDGSSSDWTPYANDEIEISLSHIFEKPGSYNVVLEAKDELGGISELSDYHFVNVTPAGVTFLYNFDDDIPSLYPSNPPWTIQIKEPSYLRVVSDVHVGNAGNSCAFYDYDPLIDNKDGDEYAVIYSNIVCESKGSIRFKWRIENSDGHFGLRTWETYGDWNSIGYYVLFDGGKISCYYNSMFHELKVIEPGEWYSMRLDYDITVKKYDIYINDELTASDIPFAGNPSNLDYLQVVAFSDAICGTAYIDEIEILGGSLKSTQNLKSATVSKDAFKMEQR